MDFFRVGALAEVPDGELRAFETPGGRVAVAHSENRLFALGGVTVAQRLWSAVRRLA